MVDDADVCKSCMTPYIRMVSTDYSVTGKRNRKQEVPDKKRENAAKWPERLLTNER